MNKPDQWTTAEWNNLIQALVLQLEQRLVDSYARIMDERIAKALKT